MGKLGQRMEDYLEAILVISKDNRVVRVTDVAKKLGVKKPSVVVALKKLKEQGLIKQERYGYIELTDEGKKVAEEIYRRHVTLLSFFTEVLGIPEERAEQEACVMEHYLSQESLDKLKGFVERLKRKCPGFFSD